MFVWENEVVQSGPPTKLPMPASKHQGTILELSQNAPKGHFGIKLECTEGPFWHIYRAVWAEGQFCLDDISYDRGLKFSVKRVL